MRKFFYLLISGVSIAMNAQAGSNPNPVNYSIDLYPKTPEAAALSKFVDIPAGNYTGVADFSIPLYTIEFEGEKIPIELRYTTTGVTVGQLATRVGLGWVLNTGPSLSQQVIGTQDRSFPRPVIPSTGFNPNNVTNSNDPSLLIALAALGLDGNGPRDIQPDIFTYNLLNSSGKFILNPSGSFGIPMPYNQTKITAQYGYPNDIVDEKGFQYTFFNQMPSTKTRNTCVEVNTEFDFDDPDFKISKIKSPKNQEIKYLYATYPNTVNSKFIPSITTQERVSIFGYFPPSQPVMPLPRKCINKTDLRDSPLTEIQFKGGKVLFTYNNRTSNPRLDILGEVYLTNVVVKNDKNETVKDFTLNYDYFTSISSTLPSEIANLSTYNQGLDKRLKLVSVKDNLTNGTFSLEYYESYNGKKLPIRVSNDQDFWGIYNGKENGKRAISTSRYDDVIVQSDYIGANKEPDINYGRLGNLKKITYPTGGYTEIQYEADEYDITDNPTIIYDYQYDDFYHSADDNVYPPVKTSFTIASNAADNKTLIFSGSPQAGPVTTIDRCSWYLKKPDGTTVSGQLSGTFTRNDPPGNYELWVTRDDKYPNVKCYAEYDVTNVTKMPIDTLYTQIAGTIRVSKIESMDNNNGKIVREYGYRIPNSNYTLPYAKTSGVNQGEEIFLSRSTQKYPLSDQGHYAIEVIVSNNPGWQTTTVRGKPVGYDYVQEHYIDYTTPANSYRKEYKFKNERIIQYHDPSTPLNMNWPVGGLDRGLLDEELLFDSTNHLVKKTVHEYDYDGHFNSKYAPNSNNFSFGGMGSGLGIVPISKFGNSTTSYTFQYTTFSLTNSWIPEKKTTITEYANNGTDSLETVKTFHYSIPDYKHTYRTETTTNGSMGEILKTTYTYPQDIASSDSQYTMMQGLVAKNQLSDAIITKNYTDNLVTSEVRTLYDEFNTGNDAMILPKYIYLKKGENATVADRKITYNSYDTQGNLTQYTLENGTPVSVIWGYNKTKPVAKIEGAFFDDVKANSLVTAVVDAAENDNILIVGTTAEQTEQDLILALDNLRKGADFVNYQITTYSYDPLVGVRSVTPPSGIREYYMYDTSKRLQSVYIKEKNSSGNEIIKILKEHKYNYKP